MLVWEASLPLPSRLRLTTSRRPGDSGAGLWRSPSSACELVWCLPQRRDRDATPGNAVASELDQLTTAFELASAAAVLAAALSQMAQAAPVIPISERLILESS